MIKQNYIVSTNPGKNYEVIGTVTISSSEEIKEKVEKANRAKKAWRNLGLGQRIILLKKVIQEFQKRKEELALLVTREIGMPISQSLYDIDDGCRYFNWYLDNANKYLSPEVVYDDGKISNTVYCEPFGTVAAIIPWNFPLSNFVWAVGQNLTVGNTVVLKHSEECPLFGKLIEKIVTKYLPQGVFSEVYGDGKTGDFLAHQNVQLICFTGSSKTGKYLYSVASKKFIKSVLEMGGSAPGIIFEDADIDNLLEGVCFNRFINCGQACDALKRLIVHQSRFNELVEKLRKHVESRKVGNPEDQTTDIGPLVSKTQLELLESQVKDALEKGAKIVTGGKRMQSVSGAYFQPTIVISVNSNMRIWKEEVFGPLLPIIPFKTNQEAINLANNTDYGLGSYIYTTKIDKALEIAPEIEAGMVSINSTSYLHPCSPFGGYKQSGMGREHGKFGFHELTQVKVVSLPKTK